MASYGAFGVELFAVKRGTDDIDERIIAELVKNARVPHADIAKKVNLSRNAVRERISRLERAGVIGGYTIARGLQSEKSTVSAILFVYRKDRMRGANVINAIKAMPEVVSCDLVTGDFDLIVRVEAPSAERVQTLWESIAAIEGVANTVTAFILASHVARSPISCRLGNSQ